MSRALFVDTWGWVALGHRKDSKHGEISKLYRARRGRNSLIYTSDYVLDETITLLFRREVYTEALRFMAAILKSADRKFISIEKITAKRFAAAWDLRQRIKDKPDISFTDLTSMIVMKECRIGEVLSDDDHFQNVGMGFQRVP
jgi:predicted nucleic acid-binding protein